MLRTVLRILAPALPLLGWVTLFSCFLNVLYLAAPLYMTQVYDRVMRSQSLPTLFWLTAAVAFAYATLSVLDGVRGRILTGISDIVEDRLGGVLLHRATATVGPNAIRPEAGLLGRDLDTVRQFLAGPAILAFIDLPWAPVNLVAITFLHWSLGAFAAAASALLLALNLFSERGVRAPMADANAAAAHAYAFGEILTRQSDCASTMTLGPHLSGKWRSLRRAMLSAQAEASRRAIVLAAIARFARLFLQSAILGFGAFLAIKHQITGGSMFAASLLLGRTLSPVEAVLGAWRTTLTARDALGRIAAVANDENVRTSPAVNLPRPSGAVQLDKLCWTPPGAARPALRDISVRIEPGAVLAIIGPSAAGKSSVARILAGALAPDSGTIRLDDSEYQSWNPAQFGSAIGYLPQDVSLFPGTIAENIARFGTAEDQEIIAAAQAARAHEMIIRLPAGYATRVDDGIGALSAGQRQRVALARALFRDPPLLILDEPNASLDAEGEAALIACVIEARQRRRTTIIITHNIALVRISDAVATLVGGHLLRLQPTTEFLSGPVKLKASA